MSRPAPFRRMVATQAAVEARLTARRGENLLAMIGLPVAALALFGTLGVAGGRSLETLVPSVLALALVASGLVNLAIATGFERGYGVLKRLGGSPLGRAGLIAAKVVVVGVIAVLQVVALVVLAVAGAVRFQLIVASAFGTMSTCTEVPGSSVRSTLRSSAAFAAVQSVPPMTRESEPMIGQVS